MLISATKRPNEFLSREPAYTRGFNTDEMLEERPDEYFFGSHKYGQRNRAASVDTQNDKFTAAHEIERAITAS